MKDELHSLISSEVLWNEAVFTAVSVCKQVLARHQVGNPVVGVVRIVS